MELIINSSCEQKPYCPGGWIGLGFSGAGKTNSLQLAIIRFLMILIMLGSSLMSQGQSVDVKASLDSDFLLIGSQAKITLEATKAAEDKVSFPIILDTVSRAIEVLERSPIDSIVNESQQTVLSQTLTVTSFEGGYHVIPPFQFLAKRGTVVDTLMTNPLSIEILLVPVDTTQAIKPIKAPEDIPITLKEVMPWILGGLLLLAIILGIYIFLKKRKKPEEEVIRQIPKEPAHVIAFRALDKLKAEKLWQAGEVKGFHSKLTEILRLYLEHRFQIPALERTSDEVFDSLNSKGLATQIPFEDLQHTMRLADLVKFAKGKPQPSENDRSLEKAYEFVQKTIYTSPVIPDKTEEE